VREELVPIIKANSVGWGIGAVDHQLIDKLNIHNASLLAMRKAISNLISKHVEFSGNIGMPLVCVDGRFAVPQISFTQDAIIGGDNKVLSIACASIIAKVHRDSYMGRLDKKYPQYFFAKHKGYGTKQHVSQIKNHGLSVVHRLSFCGNIT
jgi:ribonuclease HII